MQLLGAATERARSLGDLKPTTHYVAWLPFLLSWLSALTQYGALLGDESTRAARSPLFPYFVPIIFLSFCSFGFVQARQVQAGDVASDARVEYTFCVLSVLSKTILGMSVLLSIL